MTDMGAIFKECLAEAKARRQTELAGCGCTTSQPPQRFSDEELDEILRELELELWAEEKIGGS